MIEPQRLYAVGETLTRIDEFVKLLDNRHLDGVCLAISAGIFITCAEQVGVKYRGNTVFTQ